MTSPLPTEASGCLQEAAAKQQEQQRAMRRTCVGERGRRQEFEKYNGFLPDEAPL